MSRRSFVIACLTFSFSILSKSGCYLSIAFGRRVVLYIIKHRCSLQSGIRARRSMAPTVPTVNQRVEELEDAVGNMEARVTEMVSQAIEKGMRAMKKSLMEMLRASQTEITKKYGSELEALGTRLEGRVSRAREHQEFIYTLKESQDKFQMEVRSTLTSIQSTQQQPSDKLERSVNNAESSREVVYTPGRGVNLYGTFGST